MSRKGIVYGSAKTLTIIIFVLTIGILFLLSLNYYEFELHPTFGDGGMAIKDDVSLLTSGPFVIEKFSDSTGDEHESGVGWKFISIHLSILNQNDGDASVYMSYVEGENGLKHYPYIIDDLIGGKKYSLSQPIELDSGESQYINVVYRVPTNTNPSIFHYKVTTPHNYFARDKIYFKKNILDHFV